MKIIFKIFLLKKNIIRHFIILILLLSFSFIVLEAKSTLEQKIYDRLNIPDNKFGMHAVSSKVILYHIQQKLKKIQDRKVLTKQA